MRGAKMVKLADTLRSERSPSDRVGVQLPLLARLLKLPILNIVKSLIGVINTI